MQTKSFARPLRGIIPPMITPLRDRETLDSDGLKRLVEHLITGGVAGLFVLGTTGEGPSLAYRTRYELVEQTCDFANGRVPVLVCISDSSLAESLDLARFAADSGAAAAVAAPPFYFPLGEDEVTDYFTCLADESPLPIVLYNMPSCTKVAIRSKTLEVCCRHENIIGIKDSSGDLDYFYALLPLKSRRPDWTVLIGPEHLLGAATVKGGDGGVSGGANLFPALYVAIYQAAVAGDQNRLQRLQKFIEQLYVEVYALGGEHTGAIKGIKAALADLGICSGIVCEPLSPLSDAQVQQVGRTIRSIESSLAKHLPAMSVFSR